MTLLARVSLSPDELTQRSFLSRLAGVSGCPSAAQFCKETGLDWVALSQGRAEQLSQLAALSGAAMETVHRNAVRQLCLGSYEIRGCHVLSNMIRTDEYALCPSCISSDVDDGTHRPAFERAYLRVAWHLRSIHTCVIHGKRLVEFSLKNMRSIKRQFAVFGWDAAIELSQSPVRCSDQLPTDFESYLSRRLEGEIGGNWLDEMPLSEATRLSSAFGGSILSGNIKYSAPASSTDSRLAENAGFQLLRQGSEALHEYLRERARRLHRSTEPPSLRSLLGPAYEYLIVRENETTDFRMFRREMELFSDNEMSPSSGRIRLAKSPDGYTVGQLADHFKLERSALAGAARRIGAEIPIDGKFDAPTARRIIREARRLWPNRQVRSYLGISHEQLWALADGGLLGKVERGSFHKANRRFDPMVVEGLLSTIMSTVARGSTEAGEWISLSEAAIRFRCGLAAVVGLLLDRSLKNVIHDEEHPGLSGIRVCADETLRKIFGLDSSGVSMRETARRLGTTFEVVSSLLAEGFILYRKIEKPRATQVFVSEESISEFERIYVSLANLSKAYGVSARRLNSDLARRGIAPAISSRVCGATFFRRAGLLA